MFRLPAATWIASLALLGAATAAGAADDANFSIIGFSPDARYFAFEQYGYEDGSGAGFWEIDIIDLKTDEWVQGSPVTIRTDDEDPPLLSKVRAAAMEQAGPILQAVNITEPGEILAANPATEVVDDRTRITFDREYVSMGSMPSGDTYIRHELAVTPMPLPQPAACDPEDGDQAVGFTLTLKAIKRDFTHAIHTDKAIPRSRGCPVGYDLTAVVAHAGYPDEDRMVAIVGVYQRGWEGANHRYIAVPFVLSD
ncbi:MAG: DUF2259 domain-containing protein [Alphaproteobacteria bacterium]|nr:DUF2259 domain-containing protein [Alphaproteobacteria bacterium]